MVRDARWSAYFGGPEPRLYCIWSVAAILDAILDFSPLTCLEKMTPYFFEKAYDIFCQKQVSFFFYQTKKSESGHKKLGFSPY